MTHSTRMLTRILHPMFFLALLCFTLLVQAQPQPTKTNRIQRIDLAGPWAFQMDSLDQGIAQQWFNKKLADQLNLPGSMTTNGKGNDITLQTPWTGQIVDSSWFFKPEYAKYRQPGHIKIPFWLQPVKYYKGAAWYQKTITIPASWSKQVIELFIERSHWETTVWVDGQRIGMQNSLSTPHVFDLSKSITPGQHRLTIRIDNRVKEVNVGQNSHSISDHTQSNWNGMIGELFIAPRPTIFLDDIQVYPDIKNKKIVASMVVKNTTGKPVSASLRLTASLLQPGAPAIPSLNQSISLRGDSTQVTLSYPMGENPLLWDEFHPHLYSLQVQLNAGNDNTEEKNVQFGMREFATQGTQFTINGRLTFLRGTLECAIFPKTGYPPTDEASWAHIFTVCKAYGLNHIRFHSWCPPKAAFVAADRAGLYLQIENGSWANQGSVIGDGTPLDRYIYEESQRIVRAYGNHPSFCMMAYGNEPAGKNHLAYLTGFVQYWKKKDSRRLYTSAAGWPVIAESDYNSTSDPRIQLWGAGLKSIINSERPRSDYDWSDTIAKWPQPTVSHEIGQWCVYPDFKEIKQYSGVLKATNFEIFQDKLRDQGLATLADSFLLASGKLQALCYKADIEAALRTPGFGGFQLLDLHDFPGQGTALVGVLNPFWEEKGYITGQEYRRFCNATVPLARLPKMIYSNNELLSAPIEIAHFGPSSLTNVTPTWEIQTTSGQVLFRGQLATGNIPLGNATKLGVLSQSLASVTQPSQLNLTVTVGSFQNSWSLFVFPASLPRPAEDILVTPQLDAKALRVLKQGGKVLLSLKKRAGKGNANDIPIGFSSIFWNTAWTQGQPPFSLGILCNPQHPAFAAFPTDYYSNWQWWDAMSHSRAIDLRDVAPGITPIVRVIDDWVTARSLGLLFECKIGKGRLMVSGIDLLSDQDQRPEARQLLYSLQKYMASSAFQPSLQIPAEKITALSH